MTYRRNTSRHEKPRLRFAAGLARRGSWLLGMAITASLVLPGAAAAYSPGTSADFFGVNGAFLRNFVSPDKAASLDGLTTSMGQQGISWTRITFDQSVEERTKGTFNWYVTDTMVASLARHGVRGLGSFMGTAGW